MHGLVGIARDALDVAIELDRAARGRPSELGGCAAVADRLSEAWADADPLDVLDFMELLPDGVARPATVSDLAVAVAAQIALLRRAGGGETALCEPMMRWCCRIHSVLLARESRDWYPLGLVA